MARRVCNFCGILALAAVVACGVLPFSAQAQAQTQAPAQPQAAPRYASLKASEVNMRKGPGTDYPVAWVFRRAGLPVKITREFEAWREVVDAEGTTGWVIRTLLSARRTAQVLPWEVKEGQPRRQEPLTEGRRAGSRPVALVEAGVIADVHECDGSWCNVSVGDFRGYIAQEKLWGVDKGERVE
ncbi:MAG: hypothetical protein KJ622_14645 [Alphaproteobacteria bacterium]|nr:hypothetical protein [Alphaproteobacteria bacterium]